jgi:hypothetical protein
MKWKEWRKQAAMGFMNYPYIIKAFNVPFNHLQYLLCTLCLCLTMKKTISSQLKSNENKLSED